jgi:hypothetical protein
MNLPRVYIKSKLNRKEGKEIKESRLGNKEMEEKKAYFLHI